MSTYEEIAKDNLNELYHLLYIISNDRDREVIPPYVRGVMDIVKALYGEGNTTYLFNEITCAIHRELNAEVIATYTVENKGDLINIIDNAFPQSPIDRYNISMQLLKDYMNMQGIQTIIENVIKAIHNTDKDNIVIDIVQDETQDNPVWKINVFRKL